MARIHVIGAGLAGLAAAVRAARAGAAVTVHEAAGRAGGRCRSFYDETLGCVIDNGNHLLLSGNRSALAYLAEIGAQDRLAGPSGAAFPFVDLESGERWQVEPGPGLLPLWVFDRRRRVAGTTAAAYLSALQMLFARPGRTVADVLDTASPLYRRFWEPLVVAVLNAAPERASVCLMKPVLLEAFARGGRHCRPLVARESLADSFVDPAVQTLSGLGAEIRFKSRITGLVRGAGRIAALETGTGRIALGADDRVILAAPPWIARQLYAPIQTPAEGEAIVNVHYRLPRAPFDESVRIIGLVGGLAQWVFVRGAVASVTISAADAVAARRGRDIASACWEEVAQALELVPEPPPPARVIKEKRATFSAEPAEAARRPKPLTADDNLILAGDWTATGLPATIEGAIRSGRRAARLALSRRGRPAHRRIVPAPVTRQEVTRQETGVAS